MSQNRRVHRRVDAMLDLCLSDGSDVWQACSENISVGGMFVSTRELRAPGSRCEIEFVLGGERHQATAVVRWATDYDDIIAGMGVEFYAISPHTRDTILRFTESET